MYCAYQNTFNSDMDGGILQRSTVHCWRIWWHGLTRSVITHQNGEVLDHRPRGIINDPLQWALVSREFRYLRSMPHVRLLIDKQHLEPAAAAAAAAAGGCNAGTHHRASLPTLRHYRSR